jgi:CheY-like chemotaxis protein
MPAVVALVDDLMLVSRIREAARAHGLDVRTVRRVPELLEACRDHGRLVVLDLDTPRLPVLEVLSALRSEPGLSGLPVVGFFSHVHAERGRLARAAGCTQALPRSAFVEELHALLATAALPEPPG